MFHKVVLTLHSVNKVSSNGGFFKYVIMFQRLILGLYLKLATKRDSFSIVVHSDYHKAGLISKWGIPDKSIYVIDYPCPIPKEIPLEGNDILIFGGVRTDKEMLNFFNLLKEFGDQGVVVNVVGKISDARVKAFSMKAPKFIKFIDKFVGDTEIEKYVACSRYFVVPYGKGYAGGAGPIKDAASFSRPVLALEHPLFEEISKKTNYCCLFSSIEQLYLILNAETSESYRVMSQAAIDYANLNNWGTLRERYLRVFDGI